MKTQLDMFEDSYIPDQIYEREKEVTKLEKILQTSLEEDQTPSFLISGKTGTGKTSMACYLAENASTDYVYVNCWRYMTRKEVLSKIRTGLNDKLSFRADKSTTKLLEDLEKSSRKPRIVILDDIGKLQGEDVIHDLLDTENLIVIMCTNTAESSLSVDNRIESRLATSNKVELEEYSNQEVYKILENYAEKALPEDSYGPETLIKIAENSFGDARKALSTLKNGFIRSKAEGEDSIKEGYLELESVIMESDFNLDLNQDQELLADIIRKKGQIESSKLYDRYDQRCDNPKNKRTLRNYLTEMKKAGVIEAQGDGRWRRYRWM